MTSGPLGGPRPLSSSPLELSYRIIDPQDLPHGRDDIEFEDKVRRGFREGSLSRTVASVSLDDIKELYIDGGHKPTAHISVVTDQITARESIEAGEEIAERIGGELADVTMRCK